MNNSNFFYGTIAARASDAPALKNLGIVLSDYDERSGCFNAKVSEKQLSELDKSWGNLFWSLHFLKEHVVPANHLLATASHSKLGTEELEAYEAYLKFNIATCPVAAGNASNDIDLFKDELTSVATESASRRVPMRRRM